jgi:hypothetical protein
MTKPSKSQDSKAPRSAKKASKVGASKTSKPASRKSPEVLGTTFDGVKILKPKYKATHFTVQELEAAISRVRAARSSG